MSSLRSLFLLLLHSSNSILITLLFYLLFSPVSTLHLPPNCPRGLLFEDKTRLGSIPPSCYNKCSQCHPCTVVQVPTLPGQEQAQKPPNGLYNGPSPLNNKYSNYKPLGWKCRCNGQFYNP